jgi:preprotein translocase subunit SecG
MPTTSTSRWPAFLCALVLLLAALAAHPIAEIGIIDDFSYIQPARLLASTGHIVYNGWDTPMLGWQLFLGALFVKLFGSSYTAIRASTLFVAMATAFLAQRTFLRAGVTSFNATIATLALVLSPLFLPLALTYMSDMGGLFCLLLCLYACLRALRARTDRTVLAWLCFAALSNAAGGTVRQIAWLGVLVMFPCTVWLLRRRPHVLLVGAVLYAASLLAIYGSLHWFLSQPHSEHEPLLVPFTGLHQLLHLAVELLSLALSFALLLLPFLVAFLPAVPLRTRRGKAILAIGGAITVAVFSCLILLQPDAAVGLIAPFKGNVVSSFGVLGSFPIKGRTPSVLPLAVRFLLTLAVLATLPSFFAWLCTSTRPTRTAQLKPDATEPLPWNTLLVLLGPLVLAYIALLIPRGLSGDLYDRYLLLLLPIGIILLLRLFQDRVQPALPRATIVLVALFGLYAIAGTHDAFSMYRARLAAIHQLRAAAVPDTSIDAGFEHNGAAQIEQAGFIDGPHYNAPAAWTAAHAALPAACQTDHGWLTPVLVPTYTLSWDPNACGGPTGFAPVT